MRETILDVA